jgi:hypothetical protein
MELIERKKRKRKSKKQNERFEMIAAATNDAVLK